MTDSLYAFLPYIQDRNISTWQNRKTSCHSGPFWGNGQGHWGSCRHRLLFIRAIIVKNNNSKTFFTLTKAYSSRSSTFPCLHSSVTTCFFAPFPNPFVLQNIHNIRTSFVGLKNLWAIHLNKSCQWSNKMYRSYLTDYASCKNWQLFSILLVVISRNLCQLKPSLLIFAFYSSLGVFLCKKAIILRFPSVSSNKNIVTLLL